METLFRPFPLLHCTFSSNSSLSSPNPNIPSRKVHQRVQSSKFPSFLDLEPVLKPEPVDFDLSCFCIVQNDHKGHHLPDYADSSAYLSVMETLFRPFPLLHCTSSSNSSLSSPNPNIPSRKVHRRVQSSKFPSFHGTGPAGLRLSEQASRYEIKVCCVDSSHFLCGQTITVCWVDEFESLGLEDCLDNTWPMTCVFLNDHKTKYLKLKFLGGYMANDVEFHKAKGWKVEHEEFESSIICDDGTELKASLIVDASGFASVLIEYDKQRNPGYQIAHGILAQVDYHPFDFDKMVLMDWRDSRLGNGPTLRASNSSFPTFLYIMPFYSNLIFLEETPLVSRPV
ncbi:unnamed protein product [Fraxinus pennsylvanica]|uniref:Uncharacterized protein n=1 Tax=Fraxinus pennsylvanica TaxID=56036 RepID=A0AAD2ADW7_9LAMI|nr:unnamed protein product [Fraxinus pennsylvanica]